MTVYGLSKKNGWNILKFLCLFCLSTVCAHWQISYFVALLDADVIKIRYYPVRLALFILHLFLLFLLVTNLEDTIKTSASGVLMFSFLHAPMSLYFTL